MGHGRVGSKAGAPLVIPGGGGGGGGLRPTLRSPAMKICSQNSPPKEGPKARREALLVPLPNILRVPRPRLDTQLPQRQPSGAAARRARTLAPEQTWVRTAASALPAAGTLGELLRVSAPSPAPRGEWRPPTVALRIEKAQHLTHPGAARGPNGSPGNNAVPSHAPVPPPGSASSSCPPGGLPNRCLPTSAACQQQSIFPSFVPRRRLARVNSADRGALSEALLPGGRAQVPFFTEPRATVKDTHSVRSRVCLRCELRKSSNPTLLLSGLGMQLPIQRI